MPGNVISRGNGAGQIQTFRSASVNCVSGVQTAFVVAWALPFADANYTASVILVDEGDSGFLGIGTVNSPAGASTIVLKTAAGFTVFVFNYDGANSHRGHVEAIGIHD